MTISEITTESDYRWMERAGIYAGDREVTEQERKLVNQEVRAFEEKERLKSNTHHDHQKPIPESDAGSV